MQLVIENPEDKKLDSFCEWLIPKISEALYFNIESKKLISFNNYINEHNLVNWTLYRRPIMCSEIIKLGLYYLIYHKTNSSYIIEIDNNINIPNSNTKIISLCNLINYGNISLSAYPIFDKAMDIIAEDLPDLYAKFLRGE